MLAACGFQLRGQAKLPFQTLYVQVNEASQFGNELKRAIRGGSQATLTDKPDDAEALLAILSEAREKQILSLGAGGRVREFQLRYRVTYRVTDPKGTKVFTGPSEILLKRDFSFNDSEVLSKESEEALLYRDMQSDAVRQLMRRLQATQIAVDTKG
ncbi:MAG TPA: LPS assembly lipoprotein LptE [Burkholderiales bacterium]|nr:LPS assembly lipoprotein LptE [Burkholderiales bacterium]